MTNKNAPITPTPPEKRTGPHWEALNEILDPDLGIGIVDLGLIYSLNIDKKGQAEINMTLTTPMCPYGPILVDQTMLCMKRQKNIKAVTLNMVWDPPWTQELINKDLREMLLGLN